LLNTVDGCLPSDLATGTVAEIEEERRLLYVAMTRAKDNLHLIVPQRFFAHLQQSNGDRHMYASRTRFIPDDILGNFQGCAWPVAAVRAKGRVPPSDRSISVRACVECGKHRAWFSGIPLNENVMTAAHKSLPFRSKVKVTNKKNGHAVTVTHQCKKTFATISAISRLIGNVRSGA